jgi:hypothetical protein
MFMKGTPFGLIYLSVRPSACLNSRTAGRILVNSVMDVVSLEATPNSYLLISHNRYSNNNMAAVRIRYLALLVLK